MAVGDAYVFPGFLTPVLTQPFFPKPPTTFLTSFSRGERRKYAGKKDRLNRVSNSQPPRLKSDTLTIEPPGRGSNRFECRVSGPRFLHFTTVPCRIRGALPNYGSIRFILSNNPVKQQNQPVLLSFDKQKKSTLSQTTHFRPVQTKTVCRRQF